MNKKHQQEALEQGLTLLPDRGIDNKLTSNYKKYRFISCGHEDFFQPQHIRRGNFGCKPCIEVRLISEAQEAGYTYLGYAEEDHGNEQTYFRKYKNNNCGCVTEIRQAAISNKVTNDCSLCYEDKIKALADDKGLIYCGVSVKLGLYRKFKYKVCGHYQDINAVCVARGAFECKTCLNVRYENEAASSGLEVVGLTSNNKGYREYKLPCGCLRELRISHVRNSTWACIEHGQTYLKHPSSIYLLEMTNKDFTWLKLGFTKSLDNRIKMYGLSCDTAVEKIFQVVIKSGYIALEKEKQIHSSLREYKLKARDMKKYMNNGHTECYPVELKGSILKQLSVFCE